MQGFNMGRHVPPDVEGTTSANKLHKKHALGQRASKLASHGILTVRFEMPFPVWCSSCHRPTIIGQGVRFNAEKKKVGNYYSSPIWSFRFRHAACGGTVEMRTDPKNTAYVVVEGATKRDTGQDGAREGDEALVIMTDQEREALRKNAFASFEKTIEDRERLIMASERIEHLRDAQDKAWEDPYAMNQKLRKAFRVGREERERDEVRTEALRDRMGLGIELVPGTEEDSQRAKLVDFGPGFDHDGGADKALAKPLFAAGAANAGLLSSTSTPASASASKQDGGVVQQLKVDRAAAAAAAARRKNDFVAAMTRNARAVQDPFLQKRHGVTMAAKLPGAKRRRVDKAQMKKGAAGPPAKLAQKKSVTLVAYDSD